MRFILIAILLSSCSTPSTVSYVRGKYHPEYCDPADCVPKDYCNGDVLYEGTPPNCLDVLWCQEQGGDDLGLLPGEECGI